MQSNDNSGRVRCSSIGPVNSKRYFHRKYAKHMDAMAKADRRIMRTVRIDEQAIGASTANIVNLQFQQQSHSAFRRTRQGSAVKRGTTATERRPNIFYRELSNNKYQEIYQNSMDSAYRDMFHIEKCPRMTTANEKGLIDPYTERRFINIEKLSFPLRETRRDPFSRFRHRSINHKTAREEVEEFRECIERREYLSITPNNNSVTDAISSATTEIQMKRRSLPCNKEEVAFVRKQELKPEYKNEVSGLIPARRPSAKKDYFVFGLDNRSNSQENRIEVYRDLLWRVNYSNGLYVFTPKQLTSPYRFFVGEGNNSNLIKGLLRRRYWWTIASHKHQEGINFLWTQLKVNSFFEQQGSAIPPLYYVEETNSEETEGQKQTDNARKLFGRIDLKLWKHHLLKNDKTQKKITQQTYYKRVKLYQKKHMTKIDESKSLKVHNHIQYNYYIGNKKALYYNLKRYKQLKGEDVFQMMPVTFHISKGTEDPQYQEFLNYYQGVEEEKKNNKNVRNVWIVKPGENTNCGNGITVCYSLDDIVVRLKGRERNGDGKFRTFILQKYIQNPLLYSKRKFDIRHYMLVSSVNGCIKAYWYEEGYVRTSSAQFNLKPGKDPLVHLTNDSIQKHNSDYGKYEKSNKLSYSELQKYLETTYPKTRPNFYEGIIPRMREMATEAVRATYSILDTRKRIHNFELLGLDFMIDEEFKPWLIEVNTNPCLELCCSHLKRIVPSMLENVFRLCLDPLFPPPEGWPTNRKPFFGEDALSQNRFELIFDEGSDASEVERVYQGLGKVDEQMGRIQEDNQTFDNEGEEEWDRPE